MPKTKFLYGASVQGIQNFIFRTNRLADITSASEMVQHVCTDLFKTVAHGSGEDIIAAAGNVKRIFDNKSDCALVVREFPRMVMTMAPGIKVSQAVVPLEDDDKFAEAVNELERKLRAERNRPAASLTTGLLGIERNRETGLPMRLDKSHTSQQLKKLSEKSFGLKLSPQQVSYNIEDMPNHNDWIAVIHADGNGMGSVVRQVGNDRHAFHLFSQHLQQATEKAANMAYTSVCSQPTVPIPIRPVVLSGDDMTVIIRGDLAITYLKNYLAAFENQTEELTGHRLTACAGVSFIKSSYPFYYGYQLAEELCDYAKKQSGRNASCLMFHKVEDSFITDYYDIVMRELIPKIGFDGRPNPRFNVKGRLNHEAFSFLNGPYYINEKPSGRMTIDELCQKAIELGRHEGARTGIRQWLTLLNDGNASATQHLDRLLQVQGEKDTTGKQLVEYLTTPRYNNAVAAQDCLSLYTINNQVTKKESDK